jgi:hypothetical protein
MSLSELSNYGILDTVLIPLAQSYESDTVITIMLEHELCVTDAEHIYLSALCSVGWVVDCVGRGYRLTPLGYDQLKPLIRELRDQRQARLRRAVLSEERKRLRKGSRQRSRPDTQDR